MIENKTKVFDSADSPGALTMPGTVSKERSSDLRSRKEYPKKRNPLSKDCGGAKMEWDERLIMGVSFSDQVAESFRVLRSRILHPQNGCLPCRTVMVTSVLPQEGKSFVSANLGIALAQGVDHYSLLVDCDLRLPSLATLFGIAHDQGLADYLQNKKDISSLIQKTSMEKLTILPSGVPPLNPAELLGSLRMQNLVTELSSRYPDRFVIFDTPPFQVVSEAAVLSQVVDGVVLVVRQGVSDRVLIQKTVEEIGRNKIIGLIFNGHQTNAISSKILYKSHSYYGDY